MFYIYRKAAVDSTTTIYTRIKRPGRVSLFGCREGWLPWILKRKLEGTNASEPWQWHLTESEICRELEIDETQPSGNALVIDLKPGRGVELYEIVEAWGHSDCGWTPIMLRLRELKGKPSCSPTIDRFAVDNVACGPPVFSFYYVIGTIKNGDIFGKWTLPPPSSTNSVFLWPEAMTFFTEQANRVLASEFANT